jgi:hypothetical protein
LASPVPPTAARTYSSDSHTVTGRTSPGKNGVTGKAMSRNRYSLAGRMPTWASVAIMKGRRYRLCPGAVGTQSRSRSTRVSTASRNSSSGSSGIAIRAAERLKRRAFSSGRKRATAPSGWR